MGDMADYYAEMATLIDRTGYGPENRFDEFRDDIWATKDGKHLTIREMSDRHLLAAFKMFGDDRFRDEMLIRMFETMTKPKVRL